jgi:hypothetical protein
VLRISNRPSVNVTFFLMVGPSILIYIFKENQQMHQDDHFILMLSQMLLHVSAHQRHCQGAHMILTRYLSVCVTERVMEYRVM